MVRIPTHPGEMLAEEFLIPMKITQRDTAEAMISLIGKSMSL
jgi:plasmid maintenance system antidote protein VapI